MAKTETETGCIFCGDTEELINYQGKRICNKCMIDVTRITLTRVEKEYMKRNLVNQKEETKAKN